MVQKPDLYNQEKTFNQTLSSVEKWDISKRNKEFLRKFMDICGAENMSFIRRRRYLNFLRTILKILKKDFDKVVKDDVIRVVGEINSRDYAPTTKKDFKVTIKKFYSSLFYDDRKEFVNWMYEKRNYILKAVVKKSEQLEKPVVISKDEISEMISVAEPRMKALISVAFEGCLRPAEYLLAKVRDLEPIEHGFKLNVVGKTGPRPIFLIESAPYLSRWIGVHPDRNNKDAFLFVTIAQNNNGRMFGLQAASKQYKLICGKVGLNKKNTLYHLRHSGIMYKRQNNVPDDILEQYCGWVPGSSAKKFYYRQAGEEIKNRIYELNGVEKKKKKENGGKICFRCNERNGFADKLCSKCGTPLDQEEFNKIQEKQLFFDKIVERLVEAVDYSKLKDDGRTIELVRMLGR